MHIGGVRTALYNYLFAKKHGGDFILRIEDTDQNRFVPGAEEYIIASLRWCGINFNEGVSVGGTYAPYRQSERKEMYRQYAEQLVHSGHAYYAFDTEQELDEMRERLTKAKVASPQYNAISRQNMKNSLTLSEDEVKRRIDSGEEHVIRIKIPRNEEVRIKDIIRGWVVVHSSQLDDKVLFKSDGMPTYHLANVTDDYLMKITHVIRGEEWLPSAPVHVLLYKYLGWEDAMPEFAHLPLLLKPDGNGKLSKRDGDKMGFPVFPLQWTDPGTGEISNGYREKGYFPEAVVNILALLGWHPSANQELFTMEELIEQFSLERVSKAGAKFDPDKAKWFNQQYLRHKSDSELAQHLIKQLETINIQTTLDYATKVCGLIKEKAHFPNELLELGIYFFIAPTQYDPEVIKKRWKDNAPAFIKLLITNFNSITSWTSSEIEKTFKDTAEQAAVNPGSVMQLFRVLLSGVSGGPVLFEMTEALGKDEVIKRMQTFIIHNS